MKEKRSGIISVKQWQKRMTTSPIAPLFKKITSRHIQKEAGWIIIGQAGTAVAGILGIKLLTNVLGPAEFGKLALANTLIALISTNFLFGPLGAGIMRFWAISKSKGSLKAFYAVSKQLKQRIITISIVASIVLTVIAFFKGMEWGALFAVSTAAGIFGGWLGLRIAVFTAARKRPLVACLNIGNAFSRPVIAACLVLLISVSALWAMAGYLVAAILLILVAEYFYVNIVSNTSVSISGKNTASDIKKDIISFSCPLVIFASSSWVHLSCDKWALQSFHGAEIVGAFAVVSQLAVYPLVFGSDFLSTLIVPVAYERAGNLTQYKKVMSAYKLLLFVAGAYIFGLFLFMWFFFIFHYRLILLISNIKFTEFSFLLPWLTGAWGLFYLGQVLCNFGMLANKTSVYIAPKIVAAIIAVVSTFYLSARCGVAGVIWGIALSGFVYAFWCLVVAIKLFVNARIEAN